MSEPKIIDITPDNVLDYGICGYKNIKREGYPEKVSWIGRTMKKDLGLNLY